ncbi:hypothetical protein ARALYDRAFT_903841 [Arabidopsis lyrata subsp. lyrata]|uniref:Neprosin PEP catalytic domain-containing protein n=1 Tax=Arabidopsis lyrata subsp. lyrata TaxID=81972 RepID=D7LKY1_ARALL|nr:hypothetical protein ARALYDRAFT_903841 [Arabidopsis lyrata subsp. lyrata]
MVGMAGFLPDHWEIEVQNLLKRLNKPAVKSIKMRPSFIPKGNHSTNTKKNAKAITQVWHKNGECPENTVAIRRTNKEEILRSKSIESFSKKTHQSSPGDHETWLWSESDNGLNTIEAGWQANVYQGSGCYNHACSGFVQRSNRITVGGSLAPMSQYDGAQYSLPMLIWKVT